MSGWNFGCDFLEMVRKNAEKASMDAMRTCEIVSTELSKTLEVYTKRKRSTYVNALIPESLSEHTQDGILMLLLDNTRGGGKNAECGFTETSFRGLAGLEEK